LECDLRDGVDGEIRFDAGSRSAYSTDASNYRQVPIGVVIPRTVEAAEAAVAVCHRHGAPLLSRGGGTSLAGECTNVAVVIDWSKYCNRLVSVDPDRRRCIVEPGIVLDHLNDLLRDHDLEFGPAPATHDHCTLGGMIGNNSCGATAQRTGKVVDNIERLEVLLYDGTRLWLGPSADDEVEQVINAGGRKGELYGHLQALRDLYAPVIREHFPDIPRRVSGYNLDALLPENDFQLAQLLVGSEGTLVTVLHAELRLVPRVPCRTLVLVGFPDIAAAADAVPAVLPGQPIALEALDDKLVGFQRDKHLNLQALELLPEGRAWLMIQMGGTTSDQADRAADEVLDGIGLGRDHPRVSFFDDSDREKELWEVRESALGATARVPGAVDTWPGWEDSAVAPERLGDYLRDLQRLLEEYGYDDASLYGHFGQGCVHTRIPFDLESVAGVSAFRSFVQRAAELVSGYGGSLSGEHGDGQARGELLATMFGPDIVEAFGRLKAIFDPGDHMNPGKVVAPNLVDQQLRLGPDYRHAAGPTYFRYPDDDGSFGRAVLRCVGVGKCRREGGGVMCPSYMATREEEDSTRGRARMLFEMLDGDARGGAISRGWRSREVLDALDLCLACKGCKADCPVNVDMATYKAEFLAHHFARRLRPASHYSMGWLPLWTRLAAARPGLVNRLTHARGLSRVVKRLGGIAWQRTLPDFADQTFQAWFGHHEPSGDGHLGEVLLWPDTFTNHFDPSIARAAVQVIEAAGWRVVVPTRSLCCGLTWISTGQLATARRVIQHTVDELRLHVRSGGLVLGLEPSCTAVFRSDAVELFPDDQDVIRLQHQTVTLAELLRDHSPGWTPPRMNGTALVQIHCHHHAVMGYRSDNDLLVAMGLDVNLLDSGCCGLAGNFGFEDGHFEVSQACAERVLLPAVRDAKPTDLVLADGFSCRTQIRQLDSGGRQSLHLAQVLLEALNRVRGQAAADEANL
jgi:FAD/FMN-containing dehydrogenase/Fe-S oxidoreductase